MASSPSMSRNKDVKRASDSSEETLLSIPGATVHFIDRKDSPHLATGTFSLIRLIEDGETIAVFVKVGDNLSWPLLKDQTTARLGKNCYFFSLKLGVAEEDSSEGSGNLNYGVTFGGRGGGGGGGGIDDGEKDALSELDRLLGLYTCFSSPSMVVRGGANERRVVDQVGQDDQEKAAKEEEKIRCSSAYWTALAPNVEEYSGNVAKAIARGSGHIIRGIFWCSHAAIAQLEKGEDYMKKRTKPNTKPAHISPLTIQNLQRVNKLSKMTEKVTKGILSGLVTTSGTLTGSVVKSKAGQKFFKSLPGEVALATLDSFTKIFDAMEMAGKNVLTSTKSATSAIVTHKYGEEAGEATKVGLSTTSHVFATAWTIIKLRKALNQRRNISKSSVMKGAGKAAMNIATTSKK